MTRRLALAALLLGSAAGRAAEPVDAEFFEKKVRPLLLAQCAGCHGPEKQKGGLRLDSRAAALKGGDTGPAADPGAPDRSLLVKAVGYADDLKMPPKGKLADADIATLTAWVKGGMPWPDSGTTAKAGPQETFDLHARARAQWSFQPVRRPAVPEIRNPKSGVRNPIDAFIRAKLTERGLAPAPEADRRTLIRRVSFDLIGLPPAPQEVEAFVNDPAPDAYEKLVDRLLASPHYGERWGRHWLDLARFAETQGHEFDFEIPDAWRYRDWVVRAFNADLPYDRFLTEQIAGDLLPDPRTHPAGWNESALGTGFWWLGEAKHSPVDSRAEYADRTDNQIDVFGKTVLGLTLGCARCHDHKFDPVSAKDYYALFGVLSSSRYHRLYVEDAAATAKALHALKAARGPAAEPDAAKADPAAGWRAKATAFEAFVPGWRSRWDAAGFGFRPDADTPDRFPHSGRESLRLQGALRSPTFVIDRPLVAVRVAGKDARARLVVNGLQLIQSPIYGGLAQGVNHGPAWRWLVFDVRMWKGQPAYLEFLDDGPGFVAVAEAHFADAPPPGGEYGSVSLPPDTPAYRELEAKVPTPQRAVGMRDGAGRNERVAIRGNHKTPGEDAPRAFLAAFAKPPFAGPGSGRLELAAAVTDPANPLTARVVVNRLWKHHFGEGIVRTPDDFGVQGQPPTHPELLDWLASELVTPSTPAGGRPWALKRVHRLMVTSATYRQSSRATPEVAAKAVTADPQNRLLHRQNPRRLEAEAIRDAILVVSGRLDRTLEGPGVLPHLSEHSVGRGRPGSGPLDGNGRRSLYLQVRRNFLNPMFVAFDYPTPFTTIGRRSVSNVPAQALAMLNNPFVLQQAELWAKRTLAEPGLTPAQRVGRMYAAAFGRPPTPAESAAAAEFLAAAGADHPQTWADLAHVLFNAKDFVFVE